MLAPLHNIGRFLAHHPLTRKRRVAAVGRYLQWQVKSRFRDEIIVEWIAGTRLAVRRGMTGATGNIYAGLHEFYDMAFAIHFLRAEDVFADVGANIGSYTILASGVAGARTIAFEPDPGTAASLEKNIQLNGLSERVEIHIAALGESAGRIRFSMGRDTENRVVGADEPEGREVRVEMLDAAVGDRVPSFIKIDVEGYETEVLRGALSLLEKPELKAVLTENKSEPVVKMLEAAGFREVAYDAFQRKLVQAREIAMANALFVRDATFVEHRVATAKFVSVLGQLI